MTLKDNDKVTERHGVATSGLRKTGQLRKIVSMHNSSRAPKPAAKSP